MKTTGGDGEELQQQPGREADSRPAQARSPSPSGVNISRSIEVHDADDGDQVVIEEEAEAQVKPEATDAQPMSSRTDQAVRIMDGKENDEALTSPKFNSKLRQGITSKEHLQSHVQLEANFSQDGEEPERMPQSPMEPREQRSQMNFLMQPRKPQILQSAVEIIQKENESQEDAYS